MDIRGECYPPGAYAALHLDCPTKVKSYVLMFKLSCVCSLTHVLLLLVAALAVEELGDHLSTLILLHHQLLSISPTGALYVC